MKILLVDDEREEREGIAYLIEKFKYPLKIVQAANGQEALEQVGSQNIDILFTDVKMPVMNGLDLAKEVHARYPEIKIIIFSAYGEFEYAKQALAANAVSYLLKPIEIDEFCSLIEKVMETIEEEKILCKKQAEDEGQNRRNLLYKIFTSERVEDGEIMKLSEILFVGKKPECLLINVEFIDGFFVEGEEIFLHCVKMYLGEQTTYVGLYPNEAYLIVRSWELIHGGRLEIQLKKIVRDLKYKSKDEFVFIVGESACTVEELWKRIKRIRVVQAENFGYGDRIIYTEGYAGGTEHYASDLEFIKNQLLDTVEAENVDLIRQQSEKLESAVLSQDKVSKLYIQNLLYSVIKAVYDKTACVELERVMVYGELLFQAKSPRIMVEEYQKAMYMMLEVMDNKGADESRITQRIKNLVEKEYMKDISLNDVADRVNLTPAYVSYIFKKETGQTLVKYMTDVKMLKAKILLEEGNLKIVQVGRACGYENQSYFNRLFKNYYGMTPKQYREGL